MIFPLKTAVIGPGLQWHGAHKPVIKSLPEYFEVVSFSARRQATREKFLTDFPGANCHEDYWDLVKDPRLDAVIVCTPITMNGPVTMAALKHGKHVFVEKPFAANIQEATDIVRLEKESGKRVFILENLLYTDFWGKLRDSLQTQIGELSMYDHASHGCIAQGGDPWGFGNTDWRVEGRFPLGPLFDGGIHEVALKQKLFGVPAAVTAAGKNYRKEHGEYDLINMLFEYENGLTGLWTYSGFLGGRQNYYFIRGTEGLIKFEYNKFTIEKKTGGSQEIKDTEDAEKFFSALTRAMYQEFIDCLKGFKEVRYTSHESLRDVATLIAVEQSIKTGRKINIAPLMEP